MLVDYTVIINSSVFFHNIANSDMIMRKFDFICGIAKDSEILLWMLALAVSIKIHCKLVYMYVYCSTSSIYLAWSSFI